MRKLMIIMFTFSFLVACNQADFTAGDQMIIANKKRSGEKCYYHIESVPKKIEGCIVVGMYDTREKFSIGDRIEFTKK